MNPERLKRWIEAAGRCDQRSLRDALDEVLDQPGWLDDARIVRAAMEAAVQVGSRDVLDRLFESTHAAATEDEWPPVAQIVAACRCDRQNEVQTAVERLRLGGPIPPAAAAVACEALEEAGLPALTRQVLGCCDLAKLDAGDVMRLRRFLRAEVAESAPALRVWVTGTVTLNPLAAAIEVALGVHGFRPDVRTSGFGLMHQDLRDPQGPAAQASPDFVVLGYDLASLVPELVRGNREPGDTGPIIRDGIERLADSLAEWRRHSSAGVILHTVTGEGLRRMGFHDQQHAGGAAATLAGLNQAIAELCGNFTGVHLVDLAELAGELGASRFRDHRRRLYGRFPASADGMAAWGALVGDCIAVARRGPRKVIVADLDDTMWGGIAGDVGPAGIQCGAEYPGNAYLEFQRSLLDLKAQGILLALCSKNDPETVRAVFRANPQMALTLDDVAAVRIGWEPKPRLIREIAEELNLGLNSFVFLDDSPQERAAVRRALPEVLVPELPGDVVERAGFVRSLRALWPVSLTESDLQRAALYQAQRQREQLRSGAADVSEFLQSLGQVLTVGPVRDGGWARAAQMHQRTNQFNMTTRRYDETELRRRCASGAMLLGGSLRDTFGDQGMVVSALVVPEGDCWRIDTFLMSCRVIGRQVEAAFLGYLLERARDRGVRVLEGEYIPTERNGPARDVYRSLGFDGPHTGRSDVSAQRWLLEVGKAAVPASWVQVVADDGPESDVKSAAAELAA